MSVRHPSLVRDLLLRLMMPLLLIVAGTGALGAWWAQRLADQTFDRWLLDSARSLAQQVRFAGNKARLELGGDAESILAFDTLDRTYYSVRQGEHLVAGHAAVPLSVLPGDLLYFDAHVQAQPVRVVRLVVRQDTHEAEVYIAETKLKRAEVRADIQLMLIPTGLLVLVTAGAISAAVRGTVRPVRSIADRWLEQSHRALEEVDARQVPRELQPLASALNQLFARLREVLARERRFTANAAHQIRTPLTGLQLGLSRAAQAPDLESARTVIRELQDTTQRTSRLVQQLLAISRLDPEAVAHLTRREIDLRDLAHDVGQTCLQVALDRRLAFDLMLPDAPVPARVEPDLLSEALGNLIDNALRYGHTGGAVRIRVESDPPALVVEDAGPGIPAADRAAMLERFTRGQDVRSAGSGLGLAIAQEIAQLHGSSLELGDSSLGGLSVRLPLVVADKR